MSDKIMEEALRKVMSEDEYNEAFNVHRYFGKKEDLEYLWKVKVKDKELFYHKFYPFKDDSGNDTLIEIWDRRLIRKGFENWSEKDEVEE